jgi:DNA-binding transcriptional LysR family regulator
VAPGLTKQPLFGLPLVCVVAPSHPLASMTGPIAATIADRHVQIVLTDRSEVTAGQDFGVLGGQAWRVADLSTKHAFLCAGLGWGRMPYPAVAEDIAGGRLVVVQLEGEPLSYEMPMSVIFRFDAHPGRAGRWMIDRLRSVTFDNYSVATKRSGLQRSTGRGKKVVR